MRTLVINPNSNSNFIDLMDQNVDLLRAAGDCQVDCETPLGIETERDIDCVIEPLSRLVLEEVPYTDAFVSGCFADTGLDSAHAVTAKPVLGFCESGLSTALNLDESFGVISTSSETRNAELRPIRSYNLLERCVRFEPADILVANIVTIASGKGQLLATAAQLKVFVGNVIALGCAGVAPYQLYLREAFKVPVVDPSVSGVAMAINVVALASG